MSILGHAALGCVLAGAVLALDRRGRRTGALLALAGSLGAIAVVSSAKAPDPDALDAMRLAEERCARIQPGDRTPSCVGALELQRRCAAEPCSASERYAALDQLGFRLPPLHRN